MLKGHHVKKNDMLVFLNVHKIMILSGLPAYSNVSNEEVWSLQCDKNTSIRGLIQTTKEEKLKRKRNKKIKS